jgi:hypothetical protein
LQVYFIDNRDLIQWITILNHHFKTVNEMRRLIGILLWTAFSITVHARDITDPSSYFRLLPKPQKVEWLKGHGIAVHTIKSILLHGSARRPVVTTNLNVLPITLLDGKGVITLKISDHADLPASGEGYKLDIKEDKITITSREQAGSMAARR